MSETNIDSAGKVAARSMLAKIVLLMVGLSAVGFVVSMIGHLADWKGFDNGGESTAAGDTFWMLFFLGGLVALLLGIVALVRGMRGGAESEKRAGLMAVVYVVVAIAVIAIVDAIS